MSSNYQRLKAAVADLSAILCGAVIQEWREEYSLRQAACMSCVHEVSNPVMTPSSNLELQGIWSAF